MSVQFRLCRCFCIHPPRDLNCIRSGAGRNDDPLKKASTRRGSGATGKPPKLSVSYCEVFALRSGVADSSLIVHGLLPCAEPYGKSFATLTVSCASELKCLSARHFCLSSMLCVGEYRCCPLFSLCRALPELRSGRDPVSCSAKGTLSPLTPCQGLARPWIGAMLPALCDAVLVL